MGSSCILQIVQLYSRIIWILFNKSLSSAIFSELWKLCTVTPTFKGGDRCQLSNYRPISKQNVMLKVNENIIANKLSSLFKNVLANEQHGFISSRSITTNSFLYHDYTIIGKSIQIDAIYTDFTKAFDTINRSILLNKLSSFGVSGPLLN